MRLDLGSDFIGGNVYLTKALQILIEDWKKKETVGETPMVLRMEEILKMIRTSGISINGYHPSLTPSQLAYLIEMDLEEVGMIKSAERKVEGIKTKDELLTEMNLHDLLRRV